MNESDGNKFRELITAINVTYGEEFTRPQTLLWWNMIKPYPVEAFESAVYQHMADPDQGMFSPKPANIMKFITGTAKQNEQAIEDQAELSWRVIIGEIRRIGSYGTLSLDDKQALAAVKSIGGWKFICSKTESELVWLQKEFVSTYQNFNRTPVEALPNNLPGRIDLQNHKAKQSQGLKHITAGIEAYRNKNGVE